jgi:ABC-type sugar transport system ATPase subunit
MVDFPHVRAQSSDHRRGGSAGEAAPGEGRTARDGAAQAGPHIVLRARDLSKSYGPIQAANRVSFALQRGEVLALAGENGAGKSTVIGMLAGTRRPDSGLLEVDGEEMTFASAADAHRAGIGVVFQEPVLVAQLSVAANVFLTLEPRRRAAVIDRRELRDRYAALVARTGIALDPNALVSSLSVAQRQLVQVLRVNALGARIIVLDEPTAALSPDDRERLFALIHDMRSAPEPASFILVSHFLEELEAHCDRAVILRNGSAVAELETGQVTVSRLARLMRGGESDGRAADERPPVPPAALSSAPLLSVRGLRFGESAPIEFAVRPGEILGLAGLVGSGRTEILEAIALGRGRLEGDVVMGDGHIRNAAEAIRAGLFFLPEDRATSLIKDWPLWKNITLPSLARTSRFSVTSAKKERARADDLIERLGIKTLSASAPVSSLSGGNQQKVALAKLLAADFRLALLDEPTHGVDVHAKAEIEHIIRDLARQGKAFVIVSAEFDELLRIATSVMTIHKGRRVAHHSTTAHVTPEILLLEAATGRPHDADGARVMA